MLTRLLARLLDWLGNHIDVGGKWARLTDDGDDQ